MRVILEGIVGSTAYGLARAGSDIDILGVYLAPAEDFLGLYPPNDKNSTVAHNAPDATYHELGKFCRLALKVNPTITELLWLPEHEKMALGGAQLIAARSDFLSAPAVRGAYLGYASDQFKRIQRRESNDFSSDTRNRTSKHSRHLLRLLNQGLELWRTGVLTVAVDDPEMYFEFGERVESGDVDHALKTIEAFECEFNRLTSVLPERPNVSSIQDLVLGIRKHYMVDTVVEGWYVT